MDYLLLFPDHGSHKPRVLSKAKIFSRTTPGAKVKVLFSDQVQKVTLAHELYPKTINLKACNEVPMIRIFSVDLKGAELNHKVLALLDKAIDTPTIYMLNYRGKTRYVASHIRPSDAEKGKWVSSSYFESPWIDGDSEYVDLPIVLSLKALYHSLLERIIPLNIRGNESISELVSRADRLGLKERELQKTNAKMLKEKQPNRKIDLNKEVRRLNQEIAQLKAVEPE